MGGIRKDELKACMECGIGGRGGGNREERWNGKRLRGLVRVEVELQSEGDEDDELREDGRDDLIRLRLRLGG